MKNIFKKEDLVNESDDNIILKPHSFVFINDKSSIRSIFFSILFIFLTIVGINIVYNVIFPHNLVMKIGDVKITKEDYETIYNEVLFAQKMDGYNSINLPVDEILELKNNDDIYDIVNIKYVRDFVLLGLKAKELGYEVDKTVYRKEKEQYGELYEYFLLSQSLKNKIKSQDTQMTINEKQSVYTNNKEDFINHEKSTITYKKYYVDENLKPVMDISNIEPITQTYNEFSLENYVANPPKNDSVKSLMTGLYEYYEVIENNIVYYSYNDVKNTIQEEYTTFQTDTILNVYITEMANKHKINIYV